MPTNYTGVSDTGPFDSGGNTLPVDGDALAAASVVDAFKQILDLLQGLNDRAWTTGAGNDWANDHDWLAGTIAKIQGVLQIDGAASILHTPSADTMALAVGDTTMVNTWGNLFTFKVNNAPNVYVRLFRGNTNNGWMFTFNADWNEGGATWVIDNNGFNAGGFQIANGIFTLHRDTTGANFATWESEFGMTPYVPDATIGGTKGSEVDGPIRLIKGGSTGVAGGSPVPLNGEVYPSLVCRGWVQFDAAGNINRHARCTSVTRIGVGIYDVVFQGAVSDDAYYFVSPHIPGAAAEADHVVRHTIVAGGGVPQFQLRVYKLSVPAAAGPVDLDKALADKGVCVAIFTAD